MIAPSRRLAGGTIPAALVPIAVAFSLAAIGLWSLPDAPPPGAAAPAGPAAAGDYVLAATWPLPVNPLAPLDVALAPGGRLFVADGRRNAVLVYSADGALRASWEIWDAAPFERDPAFVFVPAALEVNPELGRVYIFWQRYDALPAGLVPSLIFLDIRTLDGGTEPLVVLPTVVQGVSDVARDPLTGDLLLLSDGLVRRLRMTTRLLDRVYLLGEPGGPTRRLAATYDGRVALVRPAERTVRLFSSAGEPIGRLDVGADTPLAAADAGGNLLVLVRSAEPEDPGAPLVLTFEPSGALVGRQAAAALRASPPATTEWPFALVVGDGTVALTTGGARFELHWFDRTFQPLGRRLGERTRPRFTPALFEPDAVYELALSSAPDGRVTVLNGRENVLLALDHDGGANLLGGVPDGALDLAVDGQGRAFVSTRSGELVRLAPGDTVTPTWTVACDCDLGGRLASAGDTIYASQPRRHGVVPFDALDGIRLRPLSYDQGVGLWPSDIVVAADGRLFTADLVAAQLQGWRSAAGPEVIWQAGLLSGPRRLATGRLADGTPALAAIMSDGFVELHATADGNLVARWRPVQPDGTSIEAADIALDPDGRVLLADRRAHAVRVFEPGLGIPLTPSPAVGATPTPSELSCAVHGDKTAAPGVVVLGETVGVTLTLAADCPSRARAIGADIVLLMDRSTSMKGPPLEAAQAAARSFVELLDVRSHRVGLASFATQASMDVPLTDSIPAVIDGIEALVAAGETDMAGGLLRATANLRDFGRAEALPVIVLLTDGQYSPTTGDPRPIAAEARNGGVQIYAIGLGSRVDRALLGELAGDAGRTFEAPTPSELFPIYGQILRLVLESLAGNLIIDDELANGLSYVDGSARPGAVVGADRLRWGRSLLPSGGITLTYALRAEALGCRPTNRRAVADYTDADGARRNYVFPVPTICVVTPTPSPTATPTPEPRAVFLPIVYLRQCLSGTAQVDVILLIDTSASMSGAKMAQARVAARVFLDQLNLPVDQAAVIGFSTTAQVAAPLTGDRAALDQALAGLANSQGTRIDVALWAAVRELLGPRHNAPSRSAIVLLSDGGHNGPVEPVHRAAGDAAMLGAAVYTIGLGADADMALLRAISGEERSYFAPDGGQLEEIYRELAVTIPCR